LVLAVQGHQMPMAQMALILFLVLLLLRAVAVVVAPLQTLALVAALVVAEMEYLLERGRQDRVSLAVRVT
jgi:hypothetical protein